MTETHYVHVTHNHVYDHVLRLPPFDVDEESACDGRHSEAHEEHDHCLREHCGRLLQQTLHLQDTPWITSLHEGDEDEDEEEEEKSPHNYIL